MHQGSSRCLCARSVFCLLGWALGLSGQVIIFPLDRIGSMVCRYFNGWTHQVSIHKAGKHGGCCFLVLRVYELIQLHEHRESPEELRDHVFSALFRHEAFRVWVRVGCGAWVREHIIACQAKLGLCETWRGVSVFPPLFFYEAPRINLDWLCLILTQTFVETSSQAATQCNTSFLRTFGRAVSLCQSLACTYFVLPVIWRELLAIWLYF